MEILVFKTNLRYKKNMKEIIPHLGKLQGIHKWTVDFHDKDRVLRIVSNDLSPRTIESTLKTAGYECEELTN